MIFNSPFDSKLIALVRNLYPQIVAMQLLNSKTPLDEFKIPSIFVIPAYIIEEIKLHEKRT